MFTVIQKWDFSMNPLNEFYVRTVYAVDRATESFLVTSHFGDEFIWIPIKTCEPYQG